VLSGHSRPDGSCRPSSQSLAVEPGIKMGFLAIDNLCDEMEYTTTRFYLPVLSAIDALSHCPETKRTWRRK
jgi:hypothetical protein